MRSKRHPKGGYPGAGEKAPRTFWDWYYIGCAVLVLIGIVILIATWIGY